MIANDAAVFDALSDVTDELQRTRQMLVAICGKLGIDAAEAQRLPGEEPGERLPWPPPYLDKHPERM